ncbi:AMP-binding protein, partial [Rhizobium sp. Root1203]|uniref:AMP-binding protein n=1 Tax=Rhizobium sp. Root1203 TaxID=1736427 RepID=UPI001AED0BD0
MPARFEAQAARTPDAVALRFGDAQVSYGDLNRRANRLAHRLIDEGVGPESVVGLCLGRSIEMVVALLAVLKSGAAYLPLDPDYPADRLAFMLDDAKPSHVLTAAALSGRLPAGIRKLEVDRVDLAGSREDDPTDEDRTAPLTAANAAYIIYTSGSTGRPKGVVIEHAALR